MKLENSMAFHDGEDAYSRGDYATALRKSRPLAAQGHARAQYRLGVLYTFGQGVEQDDVEAGKWFHKAMEKLQQLAGQGDAGAQFSLGGMYFNGWGVRLEFTEAVKWYRRAAEQGHPYAQFNLGKLCAIGDGVQRDSVEAQKWFSLAAAQGVEGAGENRDRVAKINSILATGDGSRERPYVVSSVKEEYLILQHFDQKLMLQALVNVDGKRMDMMSCEDGTAYFFDISTFFGRLTQQL